MRTIAYVSLKLGNDLRVSVRRKLDRAEIKTFKNLIKEMQRAKKNERK